METKSPLLSKTLWINFIVAGLAIFVPSVAAQITANPELAIGAFAVINVLLRLVTKSKVQLS